MRSGNSRNPSSPGVTTRTTLACEGLRAARAFRNLLPEAAFAVLLLLAAGGCRNPHEDFRLESAVREKRLDRDRVEIAALKERWNDIGSYLGAFDPEGLSQDDRIFCLYWQGASFYWRGDRASARNSWKKALSLGPSGEIELLIRSGLIRVGEEEIRPKQEFRLSPKQKFAFSPPPAQDGGSILPDSGKKMLLIGTFSVKKSADDLFRELSWKGLEVKVSATKKDGDRFFILWMGPFSQEIAERRKLELENKGFSAIIKPYKIL